MTPEVEAKFIEAIKYFDEKDFLPAERKDFLLKMTNALS
jgi:hypothetical protein